MKKELKKRRADNNVDRRTARVSFDPVSGHRFSIQLIMLCVLIYTKTSCGLRTIVSILSIFENVLGGTFGNVPCYNTVRNWVLKLGLSVYEDDTPMKCKYGVVVDESIMVNKEKFLLVLGFKAGKVDGPLGHKDVEVLGMRVGGRFRSCDVKDELERVSQEAERAPEYRISDGVRNLAGGFRDAEVAHHLDISHTLGNCMKHVYGKDAGFRELTGMLGKVRLQYHLTDKAWLLPPNMRAIARFMNLQDWVEWAV